MSDGAPFIRPSARLIVLDQAGRILLFKVDGSSIFDPADPRGDEQARIFWITPGGGLEPGEIFEDAARRELVEETGIADAIIGPCIFDRDKLLRHQNRDILFRERYFCAYASTDVIDLSDMGEAERAFHIDQRWWSRDELIASGELFFPDELPRLMDEAKRLHGCRIER